MVSSFLSAKNKLNKFHRKYCFEIFGFDFIVDHTFKVDNGNNNLIGLANRDKYKSMY
jgi:hypothetical protein